MADKINMYYIKWFISPFSDYVIYGWSLASMSSERKAIENRLMDQSADGPTSDTPALPAFQTKVEPSIFLVMFSLGNSRGSCSVSFPWHSSQVHTGDKGAVVVV